MKHVRLAVLALAGVLVVQAPTFAATPLDETGWTADPNCFIRSIYFYADVDAEIDFGEDEFDFGYWSMEDDDRVVFIEFEYLTKTRRTRSPALSIAIEPARSGSEHT